MFQQFPHILFFTVKKSIGGNCWNMDRPSATLLLPWQRGLRKHCNLLTVLGEKATGSCKSWYEGGSNALGPHDVQGWRDARVPRAPWGGCAYVWDREKGHFWGSGVARFPHSVDQHSDWPAKKQLAGLSSKFFDDSSDQMRYTSVVAYIRTHVYIFYFSQPQ